VGLLAQRWGLVISATIKEEEGVVGWLLKNEVDQEPKDIDHNNKYPEGVKIESELPIHPGSDPVSGVRVGASLEDVDSETDLTEEKEWLERQPMTEKAITLHGTEPNYGGKKRHAANKRERRRTAGNDY